MDEPDLLVNNRPQKLLVKWKKKCRLLTNTQRGENVTVN